MILADFLPARANVQWRLALQMGVRHAFCKCAPELTGLTPPWDIDSLRAIQSGEVGELTNDQKTAVHGVRVSLERSLRAAEKTRETE